MKKKRETYEEYGKQKKRTLTIIQPTSMGIYVYEHGDLIKVPQKWIEEGVVIGIGLLYATRRELWDRVEQMAKTGGVAKTRIEKWSYEFKDFCFATLLDKKKEEAEKLAVQWARKKIAEAPTRFGKRNKIKQAIKTETVEKNNHSLKEYFI